MNNIKWFLLDRDDDDDDDAIFFFFFLYYISFKWMILFNKFCFKLLDFVVLLVNIKHYLQGTWIKLIMANLASITMSHDCLSGLATVQRALMLSHFHNSHTAHNILTKICHSWHTHPRNKKRREKNNQILLTYLWCDINTVYWRIHSALKYLLLIY